MVKEIFPRVSIAGMEGCSNGRLTDNVIIHACRYPCHQEAVGYGELLLNVNPHLYYYSRHDKYLGVNELFLNISDPQFPIFQKEIFDIFLRYSHNAYKDGKNIIIHCRSAKSISPSLALLFGSKVLRSLTNKSFIDACLEFKKLYPEYLPGTGIDKWLTEHWDSIKKPYLTPYEQMLKDINYVE